MASAPTGPRNERPCQPLSAHFLSPGRINASVDLPQFADMVSVKLSGAMMEYDGWADNDYPGQESDLASEDNNTYRIAVRFEPMDNLTIDYTFHVRNC